MAVWAATFFFESEQGSPGVGTGSAVGWTETWYKTFADDVNPDTVLRDPGISQYLSFRVMCMPDIYACTFVRVSDTNNPRRFKIRNVFDGQGAIRPADSLPAQVQCAILADLEKLPLAGRPTEKVHHRRFLLRGLPQNVINGNVLNTLSAQFDACRNFFILIGNKPSAGARGKEIPLWTWGIRFQSPLVPKTTINKAAVDILNDHRIVVTPQMPAGTPRKAQVIVSGIDAPSTWNRTYRFLSNTTLDALPASTLGTFRKRQFGSYDGPGRAEFSVATWEAGPVDQFVVIGLRNKKTGRIFRQLRGRSSAR